MKFVSGAFFLLFVALCAAAPSDVETNEIEPPASWERLGRMLSSCTSGEEDMLSCVALKGVTAINRAARMQRIELFSGVHFEKDSVESLRDGKSLESEADIARSLPSDPLEKSAKLVSLLMDSAGNFMQSHKMDVKLSPEEVSTAARTFNEARGKIKKMLGPILLGIGVKVLAIVAIVGGGLVLLVTKALIVAKLAFILASILGIQKLFGSNGSSGLFSKLNNGQAGWSNPGSNAGWSSGAANPGWSQNAGSSASYPYARSYENEAQDLAFGAQKPQAN